MDQADNKTFNDYSEILKYKDSNPADLNASEDLNEDIFEFSHKGGEKQEDDDFDKIVEAIQDYVMTSDFSQQEKQLFGKNLDEKMYKDYQGSFMKKLNECVPGFNLESFMKDLRSARADEVEPQLLDMILSFSDFQFFKEYMSGEKGEQQDVADLYVEGEKMPIHEEFFEISHKGGEKQEDDDFDRIIGAFQDYVMSPDFSLGKDLDEKMYKDYQESLLKKIKECVPSFNMESFIKDLRSSRVDEVDPQLLDMIMGFSDFQLFNEYMSVEKGGQQDIAGLYVRGEKMPIHEELVDISSKGGERQEDDDFDRIIEAIQDYVMASDFSQQEKQFLGKNVDEKMYKEYQGSLVKKLKECVPDFNMESFIKDLRSSRVEEVEPQLLDMILSFSGFELFKEHMSVEKGEQQGVADLCVRGEKKPIYPGKVVKEKLDQENIEDKENVPKNIQKDVGSGKDSKKGEVKPSTEYSQGQPQRENIFSEVK